MIFLCQQILSDENRVQYNRACFLSEKYSLYIIANKDVSKDVLKKVKAAYLFPIKQRLGIVLFPIWVFWILLKIRISENSIKNIYSTYEPRSLILAFCAKKMFDLIWTVDLWDDPEKALMSAQSKQENKWSFNVILKYIEFVFAKKVLKSADNIIISLVPERIIKKYSLSGKNLLLITNGVKLNYDLKKIVNADSGRSARFTLFYCGTVDRIRLEGLYECIHIVLQAISQIKIIIIGAQEKGGYEWLKTSLQEFGDAIELDIRGMQPYKTVMHGIQDSDVCICPYPDKLDMGVTYPVKIFDYMFMSKPVVASRLPGIETIVNHDIDGLLFEKGDYKEMAEYIIKLWSSQHLRERISIKARAHVEKFSWDLIHGKIYNFIEGKEKCIN